MTSSGARSLFMRSYWFGDRDRGECTPAASHDPEYLSRRLDGIVVATESSFSPPDWESARNCGFIDSREEYIRVLRDLCIHRTEKALAEVAGRPEQELIQMVHMQDQLDEAINLLTEKAVEWHAARSPEFSRKYRSLKGRRAREVLLAEGSLRVKDIATGIVQLSDSRSRLTLEIEQLAKEVLPNCTALIGAWSQPAFLPLPEVSKTLPVSRLVQSKSWEPGRHYLLISDREHPLPNMGSFTRIGGSTGPQGKGGGKFRGHLLRKSPLQPESTSSAAKETTSS